MRAILLCSPNNPLGLHIVNQLDADGLMICEGRCYTEEVLRAYMNLCNELDVHLISDELYALSVWKNPELDDPVSFTSLLSLDSAALMDPRKVHVVWGMSKVSGIQYCAGHGLD